MPFADLQITFANGKCQKLSAKLNVVLQVPNAE
jgi:hypothetical protein